MFPTKLKKLPCWISKPWKFSESIKWYDTKNRNISFEYPKKSCLNQATQNNTCKNFPNQKNPEIENFKPKNIIRSSLSLEIRITPPWTLKQPKDRRISRILSHYVSTYLRIWERGKYTRRLLVSCCEGLVRLFGCIQYNEGWIILPFNSMDLLASLLHT